MVHVSVPAALIRAAVPANKQVLILARPVRVSGSSPLRARVRRDAGRFNYPRVFANREVCYAETGRCGGAVEYKLVALFLPSLSFMNFSEVCPKQLKFPAFSVFEYVSRRNLL